MGPLQGELVCSLNLFTKPDPVTDNITTNYPFGPKILLKFFILKKPWLVILGIILGGIGAVLISLGIYLAANFTLGYIPCGLFVFIGVILFIFGTLLITGRVRFPRM